MVNMEIIKIGKIPKEKNYKVTCDNCNTIFKFRLSEGEIIYDCKEYVKIKCPVCNKDNIIP
jgi:rRNA maturation endonuclease Nob1